MFVHIPHPELGPQETFLTAAVAASATSSSVENNTDFATADYVVFGGLGEERTEIVILTSTTGSGTLGHTTGPAFAHAIDTPIREIGFNQVEVSSATSKTGTYSVLATMDLAVDQDETIYNDTAGTSSTWYKYRYKNENGTTYSGYYPSIQGDLWTSSSLGGITEAVLQEVGDIYAKKYSKARIARLANSGVRKLTVAAYRLHTPIFTTLETKTLTASTQTYSFPDNFLAFHHVEIAYDGSTYYRCTPEDESEGLPSTSYYTSDPRIFRRGSVYGFRPYSSITGSSTANLYYHYYPDAMADDDDENGLPYSAEDAIIPFVIYRLLAGEDEDRAISYRNEYTDAKTDWLDMVAEGFQDYLPPVMKVRTDLDLYDNDIVEY